MREKQFNCGFVLLPARLNMLLEHCPPHYFKVYLWLYRNANYGVGEVHGIALRCGELLTSYEEVALGTHWYSGRQKIKISNLDFTNVMRWLRSNGFIRTRKCGKKIIVEIIDYALMQDGSQYGASPHKTASDGEVCYTFGTATKQRTGSDCYSDESGLVQSTAGSPLQQPSSSKNSVCYSDKEPLQNSKESGLVQSSDEVCYPFGTLTKQSSERARLSQTTKQEILSSHTSVTPSDPEKENSHPVDKPVDNSARNGVCTPSSVPPSARSGGGHPSPAVHSPPSQSPAHTQVSQGGAVRRGSQPPRHGFSANQSHPAHAKPPARGAVRNGSTPLRHEVSSSGSRPAHATGSAHGAEHDVTRQNRVDCRQIAAIMAGREKLIHKASHRLALMLHKAKYGDPLALMAKIVQSRDAHNPVAYLARLLVSPQWQPSEAALNRAKIEWNESLTQPSGASGAEGGA